jgi:hypothetical protein
MVVQIWEQGQTPTTRDSSDHLFRKGSWPNNLGNFGIDFSEAGSGETSPSPPENQGTGEEPWIPCDWRQRPVASIGGILLGAGDGVSGRGVMAQEAKQARQAIQQVQRP